MRLFIGIMPEPDTQKALYQTACSLKGCIRKGSITRLENLHITLVFLGEVSPQRIPCTHQAMQAAAQQTAPFSLAIEGLGQFPNGRGSILWAGVQASTPLLSLQARLFQALADQGFDLDKRTYRPHVTLGRDVQFISSFSELKEAVVPSPLHTHVSRISLFHSTRVDGVLRYIEIEHVPLG